MHDKTGEDKISKSDDLGDILRELNKQSNIEFDEYVGKIFGVKYAEVVEILKDAAREKKESKTIFWRDIFNDGTNYWEIEKEVRKKIIEKLKESKTLGVSEEEEVQFPDISSSFTVNWY